VAKIR